jgi:hypothetical protein
LDNRTTAQRVDVEPEFAGGDHQRSTVVSETHEHNLRLRRKQFPNANAISQNPFRDSLNAYDLRELLAEVAEQEVRC